MARNGFEDVSFEIGVTKMKMRVWRNFILIFGWVAPVIYVWKTGQDVFLLITYLLTLAAGIGLGEFSAYMRRRRSA